MTDVIVLGGGPAGLAAALELAESGVGVTLIEQQDHVGGNAASFDFSGVQVDYGSHRLHPAAHPQVLDRIRRVLGDDLLTRPRHGRIQLMGRWIHFPLRPLDLLLRMHPRFSIGAGLDIVRKALPLTTGATATKTFSSVLEQGLGKTICEEFYFPYARKIWGIEPADISPEQAYKRVSAGSIGKMIRRLLPGGSGGASTRGVFYYPRHGFGQISQALCDAAITAGVDVLLNTRVKGVCLQGKSPQVHVACDDNCRTITCNQVYSTIPLTLLTRLVDVPAPEKVIQAAAALSFRSMVLVYLLLDQDRFTEFDAHYFPGKEFPFTRVSETRNYTDLESPAGRTVLCAELPCFQTDDVWKLPDSDLGELVRMGLKRAGLPVTVDILEVRSKRIPFAYPLFRVGFEEHFACLDDWVDHLPGLLSFGRQGLYAHDNTHHAIYMAQAAARCLRDDGKIDAAAWQAERKIFATHVVED